jgi:transposase-like protein
MATATQSLQTAAPRPPRRVRRLSPEQKQIIIHLKQTDYLRYGEIAARVGCDVAQVSDCIHKFYAARGQAPPVEREEAPKKRERKKRVGAKHIPHLVALLRAGWSCDRISNTLKFSLRDLEQVSKTNGAAHLRRGRGRRYTPEQIAEIRACIEAGKSNGEIEQRFQMPHDGMVSMRRRLGIFKDRRFREIPPEQFEIARRARATGATWQSAGALIGLSGKTLKRKMGA